MDSLKKYHGLRPDLAVFTGDLTEWGKKTEFEDLRGFVDGLCKHLDLPHYRIVMIPGNHDVNRVLCENYFKLCGEEGALPAPYYFEKWKYFKSFFDQFYRDIPKIQFTQEQSYTLFEIPELKCVVAGLNSAMQESHRDEDHYGFVGEEQLRWFRGQLEAYKQKGWFRIAAVHHNVQRGAKDDNENLRDADDVKRLLEGSVNMLLHGHVHQSQIGWLTQKSPILAAGSAAVKKECRPDETLNQYQLIQVFANRFVRYCRSFVPGNKSWVWDNSVHTDPAKPFEEEEASFDAVSAALPAEGNVAATSHTGADWNEGRKEREHDTFLSRVEKTFKLRHPEAEITRYNEHGKVPYLRVCEKKGTVVEMYPVGVVERGMNVEMLEIFDRETVSKYRGTDFGARAHLVYGGDIPSHDDLFRHPAVQRIRLQSFIECQGLIDFSGYVHRQSNRLENDVVYPPKLYVPQRLCVKEADVELENEAVGMTLQWLSEPAGRFILILGEFGTGKTFLLRQLALRLAQDGHSYPLLLEMRSLEKTNHLDNLVAQQIARENIEYKSDKFRYMLAEGRVVLLFDGFDELASRVTYERATEHLDVLIDAAQGERARVVVTSRTQHFISDRQVKLKMMEKVEMVSRHRIAYLQKFQPAQIRQFLCNYLGSKEEAEKRYILIDEINDLLGLSENPRMLSFIVELPEADLLKARREQGEITAAKLYELILQKWLEGEQRRIGVGNRDELKLSDRWHAVTALAMSLWATTEPRIGIDGLKEELQRALKILLHIDIATQQIASGTLLVRDEEGRFGFIHQSVLEWLVARHAAEKDKLGEVLSVRPVSALMADFLCDLSDRTPLKTWIQDALARPVSDAVTKNALLLEQRLQKRGIIIRGAKMLAGEQLRGQDFSGQDLSYADFSNADVTEANFRGCNLRGARFQGAVLCRANLVKAGLQRANVSGADCKETNLSGADLTDADVRETDFYRAKLFGAQIEVGALNKEKTYGAAMPGDTCRAAHSFPFCARSVAINPQGDLLAIGGANGYLALWDIKTGLELKVLRGHKSRVSSVAFDSSGKLLASGSEDNTVRLWEVEGKKEPKVLRGHESRVYSVAFDSSGKLLASGSRDNTVRLWEVATGRCMAILLHLPEGWVIYTPAGRYKLGGDVGNNFWHVINLCRFAPGELDEFIPNLRMPMDESILA